MASCSEVMVISRGVRIPLERGIERTERVVGGGGEVSSHALGMRECRSDCLRAAIAFQGASSEAIVRVGRNGEERGSVCITF